MDDRCCEFLFHLSSLECHSPDWLSLCFYMLAIIWLEKHSIIEAIREVICLTLLVDDETPYQNQ
jgi:hypothetical protein